MGKVLRLKLIACGVFEDELRAVAENSPNTVDVQLLDAGLHAAPHELRLRAQEAVDLASRSGACDAVALAYGLCGRGTLGLIAREIPVVMPRVHDCISLFLGSARVYREQFARHPGTYYFTTGWYKNKAHPLQGRMAAARRFDATMHPRFGEFERKYGEHNARYIVEFLESWRRNYRRAALIDNGFATPEHEQTTRAVAEASGWDYEKLEGSLALLQALADGDWDAERFLVVSPGCQVVPANDERLVVAAPAMHRARGTDEQAAPAATRAADDVAGGTFFYGEKATSRDGSVDVGLGIDAGGTYTDAVLYEFASGRALCKAKSLTTHDSLARGIAESLAKLDASVFPRLSYVCLSTTLATNAVVEGRGQPVGLILMPYHEETARRIKTPLFGCIGARMNIHGVAERPVDESEVLSAAREVMADGAASFAVSGYASVRNPEHELRVKEILRERFRLPVVCGHELSGRLNFIARAHTAVLNARLLPLIDELICSVERVLAERGIEAPLFVVRGDGSIMHEDAARERVIESILSGPAASATGGRLLTGCTDALVVDMGGTTTDMALLRGGRLILSPEGARVGPWQTSVAAADVMTCGLGGDSALWPDGRGGVGIGPERVIPLSFLAARWPDVRRELQRLSDEQQRGGITAEMCDFFVLMGSPAMASLEGQERRIVELLADRPRSRLELSCACGCLAPQLLRVERLESVGAVRRAGVTPTDALHVLGRYEPHDTESARIGCRILGRALDLGEADAARAVVRNVERLLALAVMRRELTANGAASGEFERCRDLLERAIGSDEQAGFQIRWDQLRPIVGIGAPVRAFLPGACRMLGTEPLIPPHADVASAIGAITSQVVVTGRLCIKPGEFGGYVVHAPDGRMEFLLLEQAEKAARGHVVNLVRKRARSFATAEQQVRVEVSHRVARLRDGGTQLVEVAVEGFLAGAPAISPAVRA